MLIASWLLSGISGFFSTLVGTLVASIFDTKSTENVIIGIVSLIVILVFCIITIRKGLTAGLGANKPINVQVDNKVENKNMTNSNDASRKINIGSVGGDFNASRQALNLGDISGTVTNTINQLPASPQLINQELKNC